MKTARRSTINSIQSNAARLRDLHEAVKSKFRLRHDGIAYEKDWREAARQFQSSYDLLAFPGGLDYGTHRLSEHDLTAIESAVRFLEADPIFFRSGYIKENILDCFRRAPLSDDQKQRLQQVILARIEEPRTRREFRRYCRIADVISDPPFKKHIAQLAELSGARAKHAQWVLEHLKQASRKPRRSAS